MGRIEQLDQQTFAGKILHQISNDWMLICVADETSKANLMTASWGGIGILWNKPVVFTFIRPERHTYGLMASHEDFSLNFPNSKTYRDQLLLCGQKSGRDCNKLTECGFHLEWQKQTPYLEESSIALLCKKLATVPFSAEMIFDPNIGTEFYNAEAGGYHDMTIGEIQSVYFQK